MKKILEIYDEYKIMPNLQEHMLRVAAVASLICDNFSEPLPKKDIVTACLFHDMGNIIKVDFFPTVFPEEFYGPLGIEYWQKIKKEYIEKYGNKEHLATELIAEENKLSVQVIDLIKQIGFSNALKNELEKIYKNKICNYSDMRVGPFGVLSLSERILEGNKRYAGKKHAITSSDFESLADSLRNTEEQIFSKCTIKPEDITDEAIAPIILELKNFVIE
ncbi:MAG: HD domain-containing protein [bacterium]